MVKHNTQKFLLTGISIMKKKMVGKVSVMMIKIAKVYRTVGDLQLTT